MRTALIETRKKAGLTQAQVAKLVGIDRSFYVYIERGKRTPSLRVAIRIAQVLGRSIEEIFLPLDATLRHENEKVTTTG